MPLLAFTPLPCARLTLMERLWNKKGPLEGAAALPATAVTTGIPTTAMALLHMAKQHTANSTRQIADFR